MRGKKVLTVTGTGLAGIVLLVLMIAAVWAIGGWVLMLLLGAAHHSVWASVPALGYGQSVIIYALLSFVAGLFRNGGSK